MAIQINETIAEAVAGALLGVVTKAKLIFSDTTETDYITTSESTEIDTENKIVKAVFSITFELTESKTVVEVQLFDANNNLVLKDVNLSLDFNAGMNTLLEKIKIQYQL